MGGFSSCPKVAAGRPSVLVVDDDAFSREGVCAYLKQEGFTVYEAGDDAGARLLIPRIQLDAAVLDISIPPAMGTRARPEHSLGIHLARHLKEINPRIGIVLFSAYEDRGRDVLALLDLGLGGMAYKLKGCRPAALLEALRVVLDGGVAIDPDVTNPHDLADELLRRLSSEERLFIESALKYVHHLTPRELHVADGLAASQTLEGIAERLQLAVKTVERYVGQVYSKLGLSAAPAHLRKSSLLTKAWLIRSLRNTTPPSP
ncbi:MAG: DNA-binding response regulator [Candidatus Roseilinea sp.]|nr:MAG: DNA-binding response regulator [Candidatus Roseilinea sp.]